MFTTSFSTALSALSATATAIDVVGNNLANLNSPGFKASDVIFRDLVSQSLGAGLGETEIGFGAARPLTIRQFTQGALQTTSGPLDAAIQGDGFFVVTDDAGNTFFSRAGNFQLDQAGRLMTDTGFMVQGWSGTGQSAGVDTNGAVGNIVVPLGSVKSPKATTNFTVDVNLNAAAEVGEKSAFSTPITVYDSLGTKHVLTVQFEKTDANSWSYQVYVPGDDVDGGTGGEPFPISGASGSLVFGNQDGLLTDPAAGSPFSFQLTGLKDQAKDLDLSWDLYTAAGMGRITQFGQKSASAAISQDGSPAAELNSVGLVDGGQIVAHYTDGSQLVVGQVALASIRDVSSLVAAGNNNFQISGGGGAPSIGAAGTGGRGNIVGGSIESSTVDIAREFTRLIVYQRGYEANAKVITTADSLSQDTINLIR